jgi:short-subunit dehydrogenase
MIASNHGMVITIASVAAYVTAPQMVDYAASKAAALAFHEGLAAELASVYDAPRVRTVAVCQGYTDTPLFEGFNRGDGFVSYVLRPETVAEAIVKAVLAGRSDVIVLPRMNWYLGAGLSGMALWWQYQLRKRLVKLMRGFKGRQVEQPSERKGDDEGKVGESGVLV